jgi:NitT/TauT family transport system substrate-binding protein
MLKFLTATLCSALFLLGGAVGTPRTANAQDQKLTDITFALDFIILGRHAPFFAALENGYYKEEGLNVKLIPTKGTSDTIQNVESGVSQIGFIDVPSLVLARANGSTVKVVSVIYQKAPFAVFSLDPGANVTTLKGLEGLKIGTGAGSFVSNITRAMMRKNGLDPSKLETANVEPSARVAMLVSGNIPSVDFYIMSKPGIERAAPNAKVRALLLADFGLDLYSNGIGAKESYLKENPEIVKKFVRATLRGYQFAFKNKSEAAVLERKSAKALNDEITVEELKIVEDLTVTPEVKTKGIGSFTAEKMKSSVEWMVENGGFPKEKAPKAEDIYAIGFMPEKPVLP